MPEIYRDAPYSSMGFSLWRAYRQGAPHFTVTPFHVFPEHAMINRRSLLQASAAALAPFAQTPAAWAQAAGNAFVISGFPAGGMGDFVARPLSEKLRGKYAANVLIESKVGAGGRIAVEYVKRAAPDGLTILQIPSSPMVLYPNIYKKLNYDPVADFIPVTSTVSYAFSFTAGPGFTWADSKYRMLMPRMMVTARGRAMASAFGNPFLVNKLVVGSRSAAKRMEIKTGSMRSLP